MTPKHALAGYGHLASGLLHLNWNSGDALRGKSRFVHNNCDNVFWIGARVLAFSIYGLCFMKAIGPSPRHTI